MDQPRMDPVTGPTGEEYGDSIADESGTTLVERDSSLSALTLNQG